MAQASFFSSELMLTLTFKRLPSPNKPFGLKGDSCLMNFVNFSKNKQEAKIIIAILTKKAGRIIRVH